MKWHVKENGATLTDQSVLSPRKENRMFQALGWVGVAIALGAQLSMAAKWIPAGRLYHLLNIVAGSLIGVAAWEKENYPSFGLQIAWSLISIYGLRQQRQTRES